MFEPIRELVSGSRSDPDKWELIRTSPDREVVEYLDEPISSTKAMLDLDLPDGKYELRAKHGGKYGEREWIETVGDPGADDRDEEIEQLRDELRRLRQQQSESTGERSLTPEEAVQQEKAKLALGALNSEEFIERYGERIALSMFEGSAQNDLEFEDAMDHPVGAAIWELKESPEKLSDMTSALLDGVTQVDVDQDAGAGGTTIDRPEEPDESEEDEGRGSPLGLDPGPTTLDDLSENVEESGPTTLDDVQAGEAEAPGEIGEPAGPIEPERGEGEIKEDEGEDAGDGTEDDEEDPEPEDVADAL